MADLFAGGQNMNEKGTARVEAFSDGVFAIAITLLVLDLKVPDAQFPDDTTLFAELSSTRFLANYLAFFLSFASILVMWVNHHRIFRLVRRVDDAFLYWNGLLLLFVTFVPFPTSLLAANLNGRAAKGAAAMYAGTALAIALAFTVLWRHAIRDARLMAPDTEAEVQELSKQYRLGPIAYLIALGLAYFSPWASVGLCLLLVAAFAFRGLLGRR
jgi:uncharacterized membrane protein